MKIPRVNTCCGCCSNRTGSIILASIGMTICGLLLLITVVMGGMNLTWEPRLVMSMTFMQSFVYTMEILVASITFSSMLLYGIMKNKDNFVFVYLVVFAITVTFSMLNYFGIAILFFTTNVWWFGLIIICGSLALLALFSYFWIVIYSSYKDIIDRNREDENELV